MSDLLDEMDRRFEADQKARQLIPKGVTAREKSNWRAEVAWMGAHYEFDLYGSPAEAHYAAEKAATDLREALLAAGRDFLKGRKEATE